MTLHKETKSLIILFALLLMGAFSAMTIAREVVIPRMLSSIDGHIAGDPQVYHQLALKKSAEMRLRGFAAFELRPHGNGPAGIASLIYLFRESPYSVVLLNASLHAFSTIIMVMILRFWFSLRNSLIASLPLACSVSLMFWFSQLNKDSFVLTGSLLYVYGLLRLLTRRKTIGASLAGLLFAGAGAFLIWLMKPYVNQMLSPATGLIMGLALVCSIKNRTPASEWLRLGIALIALLFLLSFLGRGGASDVKIGYLSTLKASSLEDPHSRLTSVAEGNWDNAQFLPDFLNTKLRALMGQRCITFAILDEQTNRTTQDSFIDKDIYPGGSLEALAYFPRGALIGIFAPWPDRWFYALHHRSFFYSVVPIETLFFYVILAGLVLWFVRHKAKLLLVPISLSFFMMTLFGVSTPFIGTLYRYRYPWWMLILSLGFAAWLSLIEGKNKHQLSEMLINKSGN